jgi:hypothetical protein
MAQKRWQWLRFAGTGHVGPNHESNLLMPLYTFYPISVSDLDRPLCHPCPMTPGFVTPMHHLMFMVSSAASGPRRQRPAWR